MSPVLELDAVVAGYDGVAVVHDLTLHVDAGEVVALLGPNGAGKTTTLLTASGLLPLLGGRLTVLGSRPSTRAPHTVARRGVAHVPEDRALFTELTVHENLRLGGPRGAGIDVALTFFPELERLLDRRAGLLSGGEQQMVALGRALVSRPRLLLVDEMSLGLAPIVVERLLPAVRRIADESGTAVLLVEQHVHLALGVADRAYLLSQGRLALEGTRAELLADPEAVEAGYLGSVGR